MAELEYHANSAAIFTRADAEIGGRDNVCLLLFFVFVCIYLAINTFHRELYEPTSLKSVL